MKKIILILALFLLVSCGKEDLPAQVNATACGTVFSAQTLYTTGTPITFIGVRYDVVLDTPYFDGTNTYTKAFFVYNNAQNTPNVQQYWTSPPSNICGTVSASNLYN